MNPIQKEQEAARDRYVLERSGFLTYDKQSGSRWLDDEKVLAFLDSIVSESMAKGAALAVEYIEENTYALEKITPNKPEDVRTAELATLLFKDSRLVSKKVLEEAKNLTNQES